jgi:hypothetical protein
MRRSKGKRVKRKGESWPLMHQWPTFALSFHPVMLLNDKGKRYIQDVKWTHLAFFADGLCSKGQVRCTGALGYEVPDAHFGGGQLITGRSLRLKNAA